jgi:hypothetical protein
MKIKLPTKITKKDVAGVIEFYNHFQLPVSLELGLINARYIAGSERKADPNAVRRIILKDIASRKGLFADTFWNSMVKEAKRALKKGNK